MNQIGQPIVAEAAWKGPEIDWTTNGLHVLTPAQVAEIDAALAHLKSLGEVDFPRDHAVDTFPLESVGELMASLPQRLRTGVGFLMLRGLPRERLSDDDLARIYFGLVAYIGTPMTQSYLGDLIGHVVDVSDLEPKSRGYRKGGGQLMHTDSCDIIGLMCLRTAMSGGDSRITSALTVHNWLLSQPTGPARDADRGLVPEAHRRGRPARHADLQRAQGAVLSRQGRRGHLLPAHGLCPTGGKKRPTAVHASRIGGALRQFAMRRALPSTTSTWGSRTAISSSSTTAIMVHGRTDYEDYKELPQRRHLLRMWLRVASWPKMPPEQVFHTDEDMRLWSRGRRRFMELPSNHDRDLLNPMVEKAMVD